jgi:hypothetical protein
MSDDKKYGYLKHHFKPGPGFSMLKQTIVTGSDKKAKTLSFQQAWLDNFPWLVYSQSAVGGLCKFCILFGTGPSRGGASGGNLGVLVQKPMTSLKKALGKDGILPLHDKTSYHNNAVARGYRSAYETPANRNYNQLQTLASEQTKNNLLVLESIIDQFIGNKITQAQLYKRGPTACITISVLVNNLHKFPFFKKTMKITP